MIRPGPSRRVAARCALASAVVLLASGVSACSDVDHFYDTPGGLQDGRAGTLLRSSPIFLPGAGQRGWRILYQSTGLDGRAIAVSGLFVRPAAPAPPGGFPLISYAHPTVGLADACAPSKRNDIGVLTARAVAAGFAVALTDYEGLGTSGVHPYLVGQSEGRSVLDAARAVRTLGGSDVGDRVGIWGYSQGGHAAMFAAQIAPTYAPDLEVIGAISVAGPASDGWVTDMLNRPDLYALGVMVAVAWSANDAMLQAGDVLGQVGLDATPRLLGTDVGRPAVCSDLGGIGIGHAPSELVKSEPASLTPWRTELERNAVGAAKPSAPLLLFSGTADDLVSSSEAGFARDRYCTRQANIELRNIPDANHLTVMSGALDPGLSWMTERFAGTIATSSC